MFIILARVLDNFFINRILYTFQVMAFVHVYKMIDIIKHTIYICQIDVLLMPDCLPTPEVCVLELAHDRKFICSL